MSSALLFGLLVAANYIHWPAATLAGVDPALAHYIAQGLLTCALLVLLAARAPHGAGMWRPVCVFGAVHGAVQAFCGIAYITKPVMPEAWDNLADAQTGLPLTRVTLCAALVLAALIYERELRCRRKTLP